MDYFKKLNVLLDQGWKMTDSNCEKCNKSYVIDNERKKLQCSGCGDFVEVEFNEEVFSKEEVQKGSGEKSSFEICSGETNANKEYLDAQFWGQTKPSSEDPSKKLAQKLLLGWKMLEESCDKCYVPLMQSKKGEKLCVECLHDFSKPIPASDNIIPLSKEIPKSQQIETQKKVKVNDSIKKEYVNEKSEIDEQLLTGLSKICKFYVEKISNSKIDKDEEKINKALNVFEKIIELKNKI